MKLSYYTLRPDSHSHNELYLDRVMKQAFLLLEDAKAAAEEALARAAKVIEGEVAEHNTDHPPDAAKGWKDETKHACQSEIRIKEIDVHWQAPERGTMCVGKVVQTYVCEYRYRWMPVRQVTRTTDTGEAVIVHELAEPSEWTEWKQEWSYGSSRLYLHPLCIEVFEHGLDIAATKKEILRCLTGKGR